MVAMPADQDEEVPADGAPGWCVVSHEAGGLDRVAANELLFVRVAKRTLAVRDGVEVPFADFACECANVSCDYRMPLTAAEYEPISSSSSLFVVAPRDEHVDATTDEVVEWQQFYWVIERRLNAELIDFFSSGRQGSGSHLSLVPSPQPVGEDEQQPAAAPRLVLASTQDRPVEGNR